MEEKRQEGKESIKRKIERKQRIKNGVEIKRKLERKKGKHPKDDNPKYNSNVYNFP